MTQLTYDAGDLHLPSRLEKMITRDRRTPGWSTALRMVHSATVAALFKFSDLIPQIEQSPSRMRPT